MIRSTLLVMVASAAVAGPSYAQDAPLRGPRKIDPRWHALVGATVHTEPGVVLENATVVVREGLIVSVEAGGAAPDGAEVWDYTGLHLHAGLLESYAPVPARSQEGLGEHWQTNMVRPERTVLDGDRLADGDREELRSLGFTAALIVPDEGVLRGRGAVVALGDPATDTETASAEVIRNDVAQGMAFSTAGWGQDGVLRYPTSEMGAIALARQAFMDADWFARSKDVGEVSTAAGEPVQPARALEALVDGTQPLLFASRSELQLLRAARLASEFDRSMIAVGTGTEFRRLDAVVATGLPLIVPVAFPEAPDVSTAARAEQHSLRTLAGWEQAPTNLARLLRAGATVALTTHRLEKRKDFTEHLARAMEHGVGPEDALRALTTTPAALLGLEDRLGRVAPGLLAHLVVREGEPFAEGGKVRDVWVGGRRFRVNKAAPPAVDGTYDVTFGALGGFGAVDGTLSIEGRKTLVVTIGDAEIEAQKPRFADHHVHFHLRGGDLKADGVFTGTGLFDGGMLHGVLTGPEGKPSSFTATPRAAETEGSSGASKEAADDGPTEDEETGAEDEETGAEGEETGAEGEVKLAELALQLPFGAYGRTAAAPQETVIFEGATVWTAAEAGRVDGATVVIEAGRIRFVGPPELAPRPEGARVFDATGLHITPGLIDCHSHTGIGGGVNEVGRRVTSEVRIADVIDPDDISFYRQLAGGLTAANQLHGSANAIGGQNSVVKLRWGVAHPDEMRLEGAPQGIKFALGENPKRVAAGTDVPDEYPQTRMGVEALIRDRLTAGREYREAWERHDGLGSWERRTTMPLRRDLELEALGEIVAGERLIHCHSYRQDEILMLARIAQEFGFKIGTFQHVLEGYKVAEAIGASALGASTFSDWWAYKFEVVDAIPHNAALMTDVGVNVSINSDSDEHARRLNTEAAKAVKHGGLAPHEALKLVTINPAIQLGVADRIGSLEPGKDADLAVWSGDPLSYRTRCLSTFVDGRELYSESADLDLAVEAEAERQRIIQKLLLEDVGVAKAEPDEDEEGEKPASRELAELRDEMEALWRSGSDPDLARPGVCGCFEVLYVEAAGRAARTR
ncbi:MAG: amidohydrolase family protein [Planctomycetota bacterium]|nr:amidohydrolase family protein [Planctomycetota bacterium]